MRNSYNVLLATTILAIAVPSFVFAQIKAELCSKAGYTIGTINGVSTSEDDAQKNLDALSYLFEDTYSGQSLAFGYYYNPTNGLLDFTDVAIQKLSESVDMKDPDFVSVLVAASNQVKTQKLLLVPHSQGNFYANSLYKVVTDSGDVSQKSIGVYSVATPASYVAGGGAYLTSSTDTVINSARMLLPGKVLSANDTISYKDTDDEGRGHGFREIYLEYRPSEIKAGIERSLAKLSADGGRSEGTPCISAPQPLNNAWYNKTTRATLYTADVTIAIGAVGGTIAINSANGALTNAGNSLYTTTMFVSNVGNAIAATLWNGSAFVVQTSAHTVAAASKSIFAAIKSIVSNPSSGVTVNNTASAVLAVKTYPPVLPQTAPLSILQKPNSTANPTAPVKINSLENPQVTSASVASPTVVINKKVLAVTPEAISQETAHAPTTPTPGTNFGGGVTTSTSNEVKDTATSTTETFAYISEVNPSAPVREISPSATTTFSGTYSNNSTFNSLVFELKNGSLNTATSSISRTIATTTGKNLPYIQEISLSGEGSWQYRVKLEDSVNASSTPWSALSFFTFATATRTPENDPRTNTLYTKQYIGTPVDVGGGWSSGSGATFTSSSRAEDVYSIRIKKSSDFDCNTGAAYGHIVGGNGPYTHRAVDFDISNGKTEGLYCEYPFTAARTFIPAALELSMINFIIARHNGNVAFLDGSYANKESTMGADGIWRPAPTFAFQLCGINGCNEDFVFPPDGVTLTTPTKQTYIYSPTFSGTYNNNAILNTQVDYNNGATFNKIVFEFKNTSLDTATSSVERTISTIGSVVPYSEQIDIPSAGEWQYRVRLEDSVNASSTPWTELAYFTYSPRTPENQIKAKTVYSNLYIGQSIDVDNNRSANSGATYFNSPSRAEDVYSVRVKKASNFNCRAIGARGFLVAGSGPFTQRIVEFDTNTAITDGSYCEYAFTEDRTSVRADLRLFIINFGASQNDGYAFLDGSLLNEGRVMDGSGIWNLAKTYAFQLCNLYGCSEKFILPPDGVVLNTPTKQTYIYSPTFAGTYNNNAILNTQVDYNNGATFNKIVFEFKNTSLDTATSSVERTISTIGSVVPYSEQIDIPSAGEWQYRVRLEDSVNASSTPWTELAYFTYSPRTPENQIKAKTVYSNLYIGTPVELGGYWGSNNGVAFLNGNREEDAYSIRIKKASNLDCRTDVQSGNVSSTLNGIYTSRIVYFDTSNATTDGTYCEYTFTQDHTVIPLSNSISDIYFTATSNEAHVRFDGSVFNEGRARNGYGIDANAASYAFQLCNLYGCDGEFMLPAPSAATSTPPSDPTPAPGPVLSSARSITSFETTVGVVMIAGIIDESAHTISLTVPFGTDVHALIPTVIVSSLATSSPTSGVLQDFSSSVVYTVTAEDGSTQAYTVTVTVAADNTPLVILPTITSYTFNDVAADITADFATTTPMVTLGLIASKNVDWVSITIEDENSHTQDKIFFSGTRGGCVDGTTTCTKVWNGVLSSRENAPDGTYRIKVNIKDDTGAIFHDYLTPYKIIVKR